MNEIKNAYSDEQAVLDERQITKDEMMEKIRGTLKDYNYDIYIKMVDGVPEFDVVYLG